MLLYFFLMIRRLPRSTLTATLCPYTTLFRSPPCAPSARRAGWPPKSTRPEPGPASVLPTSTSPCIWAGLLRQHRQSGPRSEEHTSELQSLMRISYAVFCLKKKRNKTSIILSTQSDENRYVLLTTPHIKC